MTKKESCRGTLSTRFGHCFLAQFFEGYALMIVIEFRKLHFMFAVRTFQRVVAEGRKDSCSPLIKIAIDVSVHICYHYKNRELLKGMR